MFKSTIIVIAGMLMFVVVVSYFLRPTPDVSTPRAVDFSDLPQADSDRPAGTTNMLVPTPTGDTIEMRDIRTNADRLGTDTWVFAGGLNTETELFTLTYYEAYQYFQISLEAEPLAEVRREAETTFLQQLNISQEDACTLDVSVRTRVEINQFFAGQELGLSFCPGALALE